MSKPNWDDAPKWAEYMAQDYDLKWWFYEQEPLAHGLAWSVRGRCEMADIPEVNENWTDTLERRP